MTQFTVFITGANRGLGLEFTKQYAADGWQVIACCRAPNKADALQVLAKAHQNITVLALDVADFTQIDALADKLKGQAIDVLINNAGVYPASSFESLNMDDWAFAFRVNSMAPFKMIHAFKTHIANSALKKAVTLSSKMGSIDEQNRGEYGHEKFKYRFKAAWH